MLQNFVQSGDRPVGAELAALIAQELRNYLLEVDYSGANLPQDLRVVTLDLTGSGGQSFDPALMSVAYPNGFPIKFPFKSVYVADATDGTCLVNFIPGSQNAIINQGPTLVAVPLSLKDSMELERAQAQGLITWPNQPGKSITLVFGVNSKVRSGSTVQLVTGGVTLTDGSEINSTPLGALGTSGSLAATASAAILCPANPNRKCTTIQIKGGTARIGDSTVTNGGNGNTADDLITWRNTGELWWIIESGSPVATANEET